jgi:hypothetical protein
MTYYEVLGIPEKANYEEIINAYHVKALKYHPTLNKAEEATQMFEDISAAYNEAVGKVLRDDRARFWDILNNPESMADVLFKWAIYVACTDSVLFRETSDSIIQRLSEEKLLFLVEMGPIIVSKAANPYSEDKHAKIIKLTLCDVTEHDSQHIAFKNRTPLMASYTILLDKIIQPIQYLNHLELRPLSRLEISALFMFAMTTSSKQIYTKLLNLSLDIKTMSTLQKQFSGIYAQKTALVAHHSTNGQLTTQDAANLIDHINVSHKALKGAILELQVEQEYNSLLIQGLDLLDFYKKSPYHYHFTSDFVRDEVNRFPIEDKKNFIKSLIDCIDRNDSEVNIFKYFLVDYKDETIDALFDLIKNKIIRTQLTPFYFYQYPNEKIIANAKRRLEREPFIDTKAKRQFIESLTILNVSCTPVIAFGGNRTQEHPIIDYCRTWMSEIGMSPTNRIDDFELAPEDEKQVQML